jgi:hypothetical protein
MACRVCSYRRVRLVLQPKGEIGGPLVPSERVSARPWSAGGYRPCAKTDYPVLLGPAGASRAVGSGGSGRAAASWPHAAAGALIAH